MKIALLGYGKMGKAVEQAALNKSHEITLRIGAHNRNELTKTNLEKCDVAIEFSSPASAYINISKCFEAGIPCVCGSTGWYEKLDEVKQICVAQNKSFIYASNFSIGVAVYFEINRLLAQLMEEQTGYDVSITEIHHLQKLDKPSGTAITIAEEILKKIQRKNNWKLNDNTIPDTKNLSIESRREEHAVGTHIVKYKSGVDEITIEHKAYNREGFAAGALQAAEWIQYRKGFYEMRDMLNI